MNALHGRKAAAVEYIQTRHLNSGTYRKGFYIDLLIRPSFIPLFEAINNSKFMEPDDWRRWKQPVRRKIFHKKNKLPEGSL